MVSFPAMERRRTFPSGYTPDSWRVRREFLGTDAPFPDPPFKDAEPAAAAVSRVVKKLGVPAADPVALRVQEEWRALVGDDFALHVTPGSLERGVLTVFVHGGASRFASLRSSVARNLPSLLNAALSPPPSPPAIRSVRVLRAR